MKFFVKKSVPKKTSFIAINKSALYQIKGGDGSIIDIAQGIVISGEIGS